MPVRGLPAEVESRGSDKQRCESYTDSLHALRRLLSAGAAEPAESAEPNSTKRIEPAADNASPIGR